MATYGPWNWRLTTPKTIKMALVRPPMTNLKMTVRTDLLFLNIAASPLPTSVCKISCPTGSQWGGVSLWTDVLYSPLPQPCSCWHPEIRQTFLSINLAYLLAASSQTPIHTLLVTPLHSKKCICFPISFHVSSASRRGARCYWIMFSQ